MFNACYSKQQAEGIIENIAFAIGMNKAIGDQAAIQFAEALYQGIGFGRTVQVAFDLGKNALQLAGIGEELTPRLLSHPKADAAKVCLITSEPPMSELSRATTSETDERGGPTDGSKLQNIHEALLDAFQQAELEQLLSFKMNQRLADIASGNYSEIVFKVVGWARSRGRLGELVEHAKAERPGNVKVQHLNPQ